MKREVVYIQFYFNGKEHDLELVPCHGNNLKKDKPLQSTDASVRENIRKLSTQGLKEKKNFANYGMKQVVLRMHDQQMIFLVR